MPLLKEAGVVDAGAQGLYVMLDGMSRSLRGEAPSGADALGAIDAAWLAATSRAHGDGETSGYCTEFVIKGHAAGADAIRNRLSALGTSMLVVVAGDLVRVHLHTHDPEAAFAAGRTLGEISHQKADDMDAQFRRFAARPTRVHGLDIARGQPIALIDGDLVLAEPTVPDAVRACVRRMVHGRTGVLVTLYAGEGVPLDGARDLAAALRAELSIDVEVIDGGQPHYPYLIGVE
jgi:dihydroxyacetone kinase-like predicted kinase